MAVFSPRIRNSALIPTTVAIAAGLLVFLLLIQRFDSNRAALTVGVGSALVTATVFTSWVVRLKRRALANNLSGPVLGQIPNDPQPGELPNAQSAIGLAYEMAANELEARTSGQIVLVTSPGPGHGASRTALNLAAAATRSGRRVVLIDGDPTQQGLSAFGRTGPRPGLAELARGEATLAQAGRVWAIDEVHRLPFIPSGDGDLPSGEDGVSGARTMADVIDTLSEKADLVLIDVPPLGWNSSAQPLAVHADGTVLVVADGTDVASIESATDSLQHAGAPVIGYMVNRVSAQTIYARPTWRRALTRSIATFVIGITVFVGWNAYRIWDSWDGVVRDEFAVAAAQEALPLPQTGITTPEVLPEQSATAMTSAPTDTNAFRSFLIVGSDEGGARADVIILALFPSGSDQPVMVSMPRDLYLPNRCSQSFTRINATLSGCGSSINGPTLLALTVEDFTGVPIDHFALFDFAGFERIIDAVGGVEICVERAVRDSKSFLDLPAGCTIATGEQALGWVRSRSTEEYRNGSWRTMQGVNDLTRNERQQDVILAMFAKMREFDSPSQLAAIVESLTNEFTLDDQLGVTDAIPLAWSLRGLDPTSISRIAIPVRDFTTQQGAKVLIPTTSFAELLSAARPDLVTGSL